MYIPSEIIENMNLTPQTEESAVPAPEHVHSDYENSTYSVVSRVAYLAGVPKAIFENEHEPPKMEWYDKLDVDKNARIIRNLCMLRTAIERNFSKIMQKMNYDLKNLHTLPDLVPQESLKQLAEDGISIEKANYQPVKYVVDINKHISNRINNCKALFPLWLNWDYIRTLFIMPGGTTEEGTKSAAAQYYANLSKFPYQVYMNWDYIHAGNILYNDKKFVSLLYEANRDYFTDMSKVTDAGNLTKDSIYRYLQQASSVQVMVDCENSDPYKLYATLNNLDQEQLLSKIGKIVLYDDVHTTPAWKILEKFTNIPIEHILVERVKENKSLVDQRLIGGVYRAYFTEQIDSFILVSSDSDYWGLISSLPEARFLVMVESMKCGPDIKNALLNRGITYCYIDDFCTGNSNGIKVQTVLAQIRQTVDDSFHMNMKVLLDEACRLARADMTDGEKQQFYKRYIKPMRVVIDPDGEATIQLGN